VSTALKLGCLALTLTAACVLIGVAPYPAAAVMAGTGVVATGINRSVTGDCWGNCLGKTMCERDSGLCIPRPCGDECRYDEVCVNDRCVLRHREQPGAMIDDGGDSEPSDGEVPSIF
jgi:hypothetical protein